MITYSFITIFVVVTALIKNKCISVVYRYAVPGGILVIIFTIYVFCQNDWVISTALLAGVLIKMVSDSLMTPLNILMKQSVLRCSRKIKPA